MRKKIQENKIEKNKKIEKTQNQKLSIQQQKLNLIKERYLKKQKNEEDKKELARAKINQILGITDTKKKETEVHDIIENNINYKVYKFNNQQKKIAQNTTITPNMIEIIVNDRYGGKERIKCSPSDTIGDVKKIVAAYIGTRQDRIKLQKATQVLNDNIKVEDYEIKNGMSIEMYYYQLIKIFIMYNQDQYGNNNYNQPHIQNNGHDNQHPFNYDNLDVSSSSDEKDYKGFSFSNKKVRYNFIRKVFLIVAIQLVLTFLVVLAAFKIESFKMFMITNQWLLWVCLGISIVLIYALGCYPKVARSVPLNYVLLGIFTLAEAYLVAASTLPYDADTVLMAAGLTAVMVTALTIYAYYTKSDFTGCGAILFIAGCVLLVASIIGIFVRNRWLQLGISIAGVIVFGIYLIYDVQLLTGDKKRALSVDDYVMGAIAIYLDIIQIFLYILRILGETNNQL